ncbi:MAG: archaemetzincin [Bryobacteraceae bacterium]|nr:archaemetzincin [Bryobacteraceae bacterium]
MLRGVHLMRVTPAPALGVLDLLSAGLAKRLGVSCHVTTEEFDGRFAFDPLRQQTYSTALLARLAQAPLPEGIALLGITDADLYVPVLTFVFGEAQMPGRAALVSLARLREEFYGLPPDLSRLEERLLKEALHELGHTQGLRHCDDWRCVMVSSHAVSKLDVKDAGYCASCRRQLTKNGVPERRREKRWGGLM